MSLDGSFPETIWSAVLNAAEGGNSERGRAAVMRLCEHYHEAIRGWFLSQPQTRENADDLAQEFLERWLAREAPLAGFRREHRRFREFLATCLRRFVITQYAKEAALKRGGGACHVPLAGDESSDEEGPDEVLDLEVALQIQREVVAELDARWSASLPAGVWPRLKAMALGREPANDYSAFAVEFRVPLGSVKGWVFRVRQDHYEAYVRRVRQVTEPTEVQQEFRYLVRLLLRSDGMQP